MAALRVLFLGGTGVISAACAAAGVAAGLDLTVLNRGRSTDRPVPAGVEVLSGDVRDRESVRQAVGGRSFDVVVDWLAFTPEHVRDAMAVLGGRTGQYVFISSASAYRKPPVRLPITESTVLANPFWQYSRDKIACEDLLVAAYRDDAFPVTLVRPSHTYDRTKVPLTGGWTVIDRLRRGAPLVVHGDGTSLWTLTHAEDFAQGFVPLLGDPRTLGEAYHITSDDVLTWDAVATALARAAGCEPHLVHVASAAIAAADPVWGEGLLGDKAHCLVFDTTKLRRLVPAFAPQVSFERQGAREIVAWYDADPARQQVDAALDATMDRLVEAYAPRDLR